MIGPLRIGVSANGDGAHTAELLRAFVDTRRWLGFDAEYVWAEDGRDPDLAEGAAAALTDAGVPIVVGHLSAAAAVRALPVYARRDVAFIGPATSHLGLNTIGYGGGFRAFGTDDRTARMMAAACPPGAHPLIIGHRQMHGVALTDELVTAVTAFGAAPRCVVTDDVFAGQEFPHGVSALYVAGIHEFSAKVVVWARQNGFAGPIAVGDDCFTTAFAELCGPHAEDCVIATQLVAASYPFRREGERDYLCFSDIDGYYPTCTVAVAIALQAVAQNPGRRGAALGRAIRRTRWPTPAGLYGFAQNGDLAGLSDAALRVRGKRLLVEALIAAT